MAVFWALYYQPHVGPEQPIPFSHRIHAGVKKIGCVVCHRDVANSPQAGMPPLQTCMLCHEHIITEFPPIRKLRQQYEEKTPVEWVRVYNLQQFVFFDHQVHVQRGIDCSHCHGDVKAMDRVYQANLFNMGFCIRCHRQNEATHDCFTCHR